MALRFVTGNDDKVREAREYFAGVRELEQVSHDYPEIQHRSIEAIAERGARKAFVDLGEEVPLFVEDSGLEVDALSGFPGPYSAYVEDTLGVERVWELASDEENRRATFTSVVAYASGDPASPPVETFVGRVRGTLVAPRGDGGFGYDPIFEYDGRTMAEMTAARKNAISHRGRALEALADHLAESG